VTRREENERTLIVATRGRDAQVARGILHDAGVRADICPDINALLAELTSGAELAILTEEAFRGVDTRALVHWAASQPVWSDFPFIVLTEHGGGLERNPTADQLTRALGNVSFLERPFHPTTLVSIVQTSLRGRRRQYECRRLNEELELRVQERTAELATANRQLLRQMEERERVEATLRQMQRLEAVGQLTSGVAHDFNNLLTVVLGNIRFLDRELAAAGIEGKVKQRLGHMRVAAERGAKLTDQMLSFSRRQRLEPRALDLNEAVAGMQELLQSTMGGSIRIETKLADDLWPAMADPTQLELAVLNLAINARDAMGIGGTLTVSTSNVALGQPTHPEDPPPGEYVEICVNDNGSGMTPDVRAKAFEPFFTTKEIGKGSGLGLSQILGFAKQSGGGVSIDSKIGEGTSICIYVPRADRAAEHVSQDELRADSRALIGARILLVDDDSAVREVTAEALRESGYEVLEAGSGGAALELLEGLTIDLLIIDLAMPGMSGAELASRVRAKRPDLPMLFVTGFADRSVLADVHETQIVGKPFAPGELAAKAQSVLMRGAGMFASSRPH
jgi:signal transduction histidine kinase